MGSPGRESLHLGEGCVLLGKGVRLGEVVTCGGLRLWLVWGRSSGSVCDCLWLASGQLYDLFESVIA